MLSTLDPLESEGGSTAEQLQALGNVCADTVPRALDILLVKYTDLSKKCKGYGVLQVYCTETSLHLTPRLWGYSMNFRQHLHRLTSGPKALAFASSLARRTKVRELSESRTQLQLEIHSCSSCGEGWITDCTVARTVVTSFDRLTFVVTKVNPEQSGGLLDALMQSIASARPLLLNARGSSCSNGAVCGVTTKLSSLHTQLTLFFTCKWCWPQFPATTTAAFLGDM